MVAWRTHNSVSWTYGNLIDSSSLEHEILCSTNGSSEFVRVQNFVRGTVGPRGFRRINCSQISLFLHKTLFQGCHRIWEIKFSEISLTHCGKIP